MPPDRFQPANVPDLFRFINDPHVISDGLGVFSEVLLPFRKQLMHY